DQGQADVAPVAVADDHVDLVLLDEALGREHGLRRLAARVVQRQLDATAADAALLVGLLDEELDRALHPVAQEGRRPGVGKDAADPDGAALGASETRPEE